MERPTKVTILFLFFCSVFIFAFPAYAHTLKVDGEISAILHISPNDQPISGEPLQYLFIFGDSSNRFRTSICSCSVTIREEGTILTTQTLKPTYPFESDNDFIFPKADVYEFTLAGRPKESNGFQPFTMTYLLRVTQGASMPSSMLLWVYGGLAVSVAAVIIGYISYKLKRSER